MVLFVCDAMLGELARWVRILGFPALYADNTWTDDEILALLAERAAERPVLLTRDRALHAQARRRGAVVVLLAVETPTEEALRSALQAANVVPTKETLFTLCSLCGATLRDAMPEEVERVPARSRAAHSEFRACPGCGQLYWQGAHWPGILAMFERLAGTKPDEGRR